MFEIRAKLTADTQQEIHDDLAAKLALPAYHLAPCTNDSWSNPSTTDGATDSVEQHAAIRVLGWKGKILPTFRPDALLDIANPQWLKQAQTLAEFTGIDIPSIPARFEV